MITKEQMELAQKIVDEGLKQNKRVWIRDCDSFFDGFYDEDPDKLIVFPFFGIEGRLVGNLEELMYHDGMNIISFSIQESEIQEAILQSILDPKSVVSVVYCVEYAETEDGEEPENMKDADFMDVYCIPQGLEIPPETIALLETHDGGWTYEEIVRIKR